MRLSFKNFQTYSKLPVFEGDGFVGLKQSTYKDIVLSIDIMRARQ
jgi:hypothetical protein